MSKAKLLYIPYAINFCDLDENEYRNIASTPVSDNAEETLFCLLSLCEDDKQRLVILTEFLIANGFMISRTSFVDCFKMSLRDYYNNKKKFLLKNKDAVNDV